MSAPVKWWHHNISLACCPHRSSRSCPRWHTTSFPASHRAGPQELSTVVAFLASAYCQHEEMSMVSTPSFLPQPTAFLKHHHRSCPTGAVPQELFTVAVPPLQPHPLTLTPSRHTEMMLQQRLAPTRRNYHPNPWVRCSEKGGKKNTNP